MYVEANLEYVGRGGYQQSYGPPASVLGTVALEKILHELSDDCCRDGLIRPRL